MRLIILLCLELALAEHHTESDLHELELSTFYADCTVYEDPALFGGPVCCNDGRTYDNCVHMACLNHWRHPQDKVRIVNKGPCIECDPPPFPWSPIYLPCCGSDNRTYANIEALILRNEKSDYDVLVKYDGECTNPTGSCLGVDTYYWEEAVCATNGRTYQSVMAITDMRKFGQCLDVLHDGGCTVDEVKQRIRDRAEVCDLSRNCYEYNPVCGEDDVTYGNPYILLCFRPNVKSQYMGECNSLMHMACQGAVEIDKGEVESPGCVCASDGLTYTSIYHLQCAKNNDKYLYYLHNGECKPSDSPCARMPEVDDAGEPVCGSDGVTYVNSYALWCMQRKEDPFLRFFHDGPCFRRCVECTCSLGCRGVP